MAGRLMLPAIALAVATQLLASPPKDSTSKQKESAEQVPANAGERADPPVQRRDESPKAEKPCAKGQDDRSSDLCAQWKAADAAELSAIWTIRTFWLGVGGLFVGFFTLMAAVAAAWFARNAAVEAAKSAQAGADAVIAASEANKLAEREYKWARKEARGSARNTETALAASLRSADSAHRHAEVAADTARKQLRAYILVDEIVVVNFGQNQIPTFSGKIINHGQTPAHDVQITSKVEVQYIDRDRHEIKFGPGVSGRKSSGILGRDKNFSFNRNPSSPLAPGHFDGIVRGDYCYIFAGVVSYRDIFGCRHITIFKWSYERHPTGLHMHLVATERHNIGN